MVSANHALSNSAQVQTNGRPKFLCCNMNQSHLNTSYAITTQDIVFAAFYSFIVFFGVLGNALVIVIVRKTRSSHTPTDYLLTNLAVADLVTLLFCPGFYELVIDDLQLLVDSSFLRDIICKLFLGNAVVCIAFDASVINLCVIAVERFLAIAKPFNSDWNLTRRQAGLAVALIWMTAITSSFPDILWTKYDKNETTSDISAARVYRPCMRPWAVYHHSSNVKIYIVVHAVTLIIVPSIIISFSYISAFISIKRSPSAPASCEPSREQNSRRLLKLLISLAAAFCVLCLPFAGFFFYVASLDQRQLSYRSTSLTLIHSIVRLLIFSNSFVNPLLYAAQSTNYRDTFKGLCCKINSHGVAVRKTNNVTSRTRRCKEDETVV